MPNPASSRSPSPLTSSLVVAIAYDGLCTFEFGCAVEVFALPRPEMGPGWYRFAVAAAEPGPLRATGGITVGVDGGLDLLTGAGTVVVPGWRGADAPVPTELCNAFSELNDSVEQEERFRLQAEEGAGGNVEAEPGDPDYVEALSYGMPPAGGLGFGVDRLAMLKYGMDDLRAFFDGDNRWLAHYGFSAFDQPTLSGGVGARA